MVNETDNLTIEALLTLLQDAGLTQADLDDDGDINVPRGMGGSDALEFGTDVQILHGAICMTTYVQCHEGVESEVAAQVLRLNNEMLFTRFSMKHHDDRCYLTGDYWLLLGEELSGEYLVSALRKFADVFITGIRESDPNQTLFIFDW